MKLIKKSERPAGIRSSFNAGLSKKHQPLNYGILLINTPSSLGKSYTLWTDRIDFIEADHRMTHILYRTSSHPDAPKHKISLAINFDALMHAYLIAEQKRVCVDAREICNLPHNDRLSDYNGNKKIHQVPLTTLLKMLRITRLGYSLSSHPKNNP